LIHGSLERSLAYNKALDGIKKHLSEHPEIQVIIDLHRDSVGKGKHTYTTINGKKTAIAMFFNGMSRTKSGPIDYLYNPNLEGNLAFSLQLKCKAMEYYDGFTKPIYLKGYRYNLHLRERSLLIELGNENNTVEEVKNAAQPLAVVLDKVLSGQE
jgi:stage II sporulation protein P